MPIIQLEDYSDPRLKPFSGMTDGQLRKAEGFRREYDQGFFIAESAKVAERALDQAIVPLSVLADSRWLTHDRALIERLSKLHPEVPIFKATPEQFRDITGYQVVRGALVCFKRPAEHTVEEVLSGARRVAVLEAITNFENVGAIFRSAAALGIDGVLLSPTCHDPLYRRCARVSMGAVFQIPWARLTCEAGESWAEKWAPYFSQRGFLLAAMALEERSISLRDPQLKAAERLAIVLGTEGEGLDARTIAASNYCVKIPMAHGVDSLNVGAAAAIAFWELM